MAALVLLAAPVFSQNDAFLSPRQSYQQALTQFGQGHLFTDDELQALDTLRDKLTAFGDTDLAGDVAVLRLAALARATREAALSQAKQTLAADAQAMLDATARQRDHGNWRLTRDVGLWTFSLSTAATLLVAATGDREGQYNDNLKWAGAASAGVMLLSLFPLIVGQANM